MRANALNSAGETGGVVCNVTSSSIFAPVPFYAPYRASKAAVSVLGESLRTELAPFGIRVLEIMPGPIDTDMLAGSDRPAHAVDYPAYSAMAARMYEGRKGKVEGMITPTADAARAIGDAILDDDAPLRVGCDPLSVGMLDAWRNSSDEDAHDPDDRHGCGVRDDGLSAEGRRREFAHSSQRPPHGREPCHWYSDHATSSWSYCDAVLAGTPIRSGRPAWLAALFHVAWRNWYAPRYGPAGLKAL